MEQITDLHAVQREARTFIPKGCDQQGRYPEAAHAASEITDDEPGTSPNWIAMTWAELCVFVWPSVVALCLFAVLLIVHLWRAA